MAMDFGSNAAWMDGGPYSFIKNADSVREPALDISICLNSASNAFERSRDRLKSSAAELKRRYPVMRRVGGDLIDTLMRTAFPSHISRDILVRNMNYRSSRDNMLSIRVRRSENDGLSRYLPSDHSLLFRGHLRGPQFVVDSVLDIPESEKLEFETEFRVIRRESMTNHWMSGADWPDFLYDFCEGSVSLVKYTEERLEEWEKYLAWKKQLAQKQIFGCKYYDVTVDKKKRRLIFSLAFDSEESFEKFKSHLRDELKVFSNGYSSERWRFSLRKEDDSRIRLERAAVTRTCASLSQRIS